MEVSAYTKQRMTSKGHYRISIVLAFSCGREKTIRIHCVWTRIFSDTEKTFRFQKYPGMCGQGLNH